MKNVMFAFLLFAFGGGAAESAATPPTTPSQQTGGNVTSQSEKSTAGCKNKESSAQPCAIPSPSESQTQVKRSPDASQGESTANSRNAGPPSEDEKKSGSSLNNGEKTQSSPSLADLMLTAALIMALATPITLYLAIQESKKDGFVFRRHWGGFGGETTGIYISRSMAMLIGACIFTILTVAFATAGALGNRPSTVTTEGEKSAATPASHANTATKA